MTDRKPDDLSIVDELKELGRQLTATVKVVAGSEQVRTLGREIRDGLREAAQDVEETVEHLREHEEVQRLRTRATDVADSFKTGEAQREIREEVGEALRALNVRLRELVERLEPDTNAGTPAAPPSQGEQGAEASPAEYTGTTRKLES